MSEHGSKVRDKLRSGVNSISVISISIMGVAVVPEREDDCEPSEPRPDRPSGEENVEVVVSRFSGRTGADVADVVEEPGVHFTPTFRDGDAGKMRRFT